MIAETKVATEDQPRMLVKETLEVECEKILRLVCEYSSSRTRGKLSGTRVAYFAWKRNKTT